MYWNMDNTARSEWANLVTSRTTDEKAQLARYAFDNHWWDLSVQATIAGKLWDHLEERFPLAYKGSVRSLHQRQRYPAKLRDGNCPSGERMEPESPFPGGRQRLMQIMPGTATHTVKMFNIHGYSGPSQLLDRIPTSTSVPATCSMCISSSAITASSRRRRITRGRVACALARQQRRTHRRRGVCREHPVLGNARLREERAGL